MPPQKKRSEALALREGLWGRDLQLATRTGEGEGEGVFETRAQYEEVSDGSIFLVLFAHAECLS